MKDIIDALDTYIDKYKDMCLWSDEEFETHTTGTIRQDFIRNMKMYRMKTTSGLPYHCLSYSGNGGSSPFTMSSIQYLDSRQNNIVDSDGICFYAKDILQWCSPNTQSYIISTFDEETHFQLSTLHPHVPDFETFCGIGELYELLQHKCNDTYVYVNFAAMKEYLNEKF